MGINDRDYGRYDPGGGGRFRRALRRIFVEGDSFFAWSLPLFTLWRIRVRIHLIFVLMIVGELVGAALQTDTIGVAYRAYGMAALFVLVLAHEFGHCIACRFTGGDADQILMWPLGGLAFCAPAGGWKAHLITTLGGPGVNLVLVPILGAAVLALKLGWGAVLFNPFLPGAVITHAVIVTPLQSCVWWLYYMNLVLLLFNMLIPMYPLDCGRVVQELLWARIGYERSMKISVNLGLVMAVTLGLFASATQQSRLFALAIFAGLSCWDQRRRLLFMEAEAGMGQLPGYDFDRGYRGMPGGEERPSAREGAAYRRAQKQQERERAEQAEVDRILAKIAESGMGSLSRRERRTLEDATARKRGHESGR